MLNASRHGGAHGAAGSDASGAPPASFYAALCTLLKMPVYVSLMLASTLSGAGGHVMDAWAAVFFSRVYTNDFAAYTSVTAFYSVVLGGISSYLSGYLSDHLESKGVAGAKVSSRSRPPNSLSLSFSLVTQTPPLSLAQNC